MDSGCHSIGIVFLLVLLSTSAGSCDKHNDRLAPIPFSDNFQRNNLGDNWQPAPGWRLENGWVFSSGTKNRPLWLRSSIPNNAVIELDAKSESPAGDIKFEIYGDGQHHASGYILILGGWNNSISTIARLDEHGQDRQELKQKGIVKMGRTYHMKVVRKDKVIRWYVDGKLLLDYYDSEPLRGEGHDRFAFNDWDSNLYFDNLSIRELKADDRVKDPQQLPTKE